VNAERKTAGAGRLSVIPGCRLFTLLSSLDKGSKVQKDLTLHHMRSGDVPCVTHTLS
jgi:hypothetical protein